jgi:hypothetical protein
MPSVLLTQHDVDSAIWNIAEQIVDIRRKNTSFFPGNCSTLVEVLEIKKSANEKTKSATLLGEDTATITSNVREELIELRGVDGTIMVMLPQGRDVLQSIIDLMLTGPNRDFVVDRLKLYQIQLSMKIPNDDNLYHSITAGDGLCSLRAANIVENEHFPAFKIILLLFSVKVKHKKSTSLHQVK